MLKIGTISPPGWTSFCGDEMQSAAKIPLEIIDQPMALGDAFSFQVDEIRRASQAIEDAACRLADQNVAAILQIGGPFAFLHGATKAQEIETRISDRIGIPFEMMALSMLRSLSRQNAQKVTVCSAYYPEAWNAGLLKFLASSGTHVSKRMSFAELGVSPAQDATGMAEDFEDISPEHVLKALSLCAEITPASAIYLSGIPCPLLSHRAALSAVSRGPVINYLDSYARLFERIGVTSKI